MAKELKKKRDEAKQAWENATVVVKKAKKSDDFTVSKKAHDEAEKLRVEYLKAEKASDTDSDDENTLAISAHR
jgi:RecB family endonuclease NucS